MAKVRRPNTQNRMLSPDEAWRRLAVQAGGDQVRSYPDPEKQLAAAVIHQAVKEAKSSNGRAAAARRWLLSSEAGLMLGLVGLDRSCVEAFVAGLG